MSSTPLLMQDDDVMSINSTDPQPSPHGDYTNTLQNNNQFQVPQQAIKRPTHSLKKKKNQKAHKSNAKTASQLAAQQSALKAKSKPPVIEIQYDSSDLSQPLPIGYKAYAIYPTTMKWYEIKILERKLINPNNDNDMYLIDAPALTAEQGGDSTYDSSTHRYIYYVHYMEWDRRMDEWLPRNRIRLASQISSILQKQRLDEIQQIQRSESKNELREEKKEADNELNTSTDVISKDGTGKGKEGGTVDNDAAHGTGNAGHGHGHFSEEDLRAHEEATKVKNIDTLVFGVYRMQTWYYSPFPSEYNRYKTLYFCEFCLSYFGVESELNRHSAKCSVRHPPGNEIYRSAERNVTVAVFELDGQIEKVYCQSLCYIGKLYLDHKTLEYDCTPFLFYVICEVDSLGYHPVGYFSKEKHAASNFNLACILTLPCHQRKGYGKFIISLSYELSKIEERVGSPEKPISDLGQQAYSSYWSHVLVHELAQNRQQGQMFSIEQLSQKTCITCDDIIETLKLLQILQWYNGRWVYSHTQVQKLEQDRIRREQKLQQSLDKDPKAMYVAPCRPEQLHWTPYVIKPNKNKSIMPVY